MSKKFTKVIKDPVHGYISLTDFELRIVDTPQFQRLFDIQQLTSQHLYPAAKHTRGEHSLGVLELTKQAIKHLNKNGFISLDSTDAVISDDLAFNCLIAALLHDIGHAPLSHLGESIMRKNDAINRFYRDLYDSNLSGLKEEHQKKNEGATHEITSCIIILEKYRPYFDTLRAQFPNEVGRLDYELIIRCIIGMEYEPIDAIHLKKNMLVRLINSNNFDMDKLDYIMRDCWHTGIHAPVIDTRRLFRNMWVSYPETNDCGYEIVFTSKAVSALQSIIDASDILYMNVCNHHTVVYSNFLYMYIFLRLDRAFRLREETEPSEKLETNDECLKGRYPKERLFSVESVVDDMVSDCDVLAVLNMQYRAWREYYSKNKALDNGAKPVWAEHYCDDEWDYAKKALRLVKRLKNRDFLKSWWKKVYEFDQFKVTEFSSPTEQEVISKLSVLICGDSDKIKDYDERNLKAIDFRKKLANRVCSIVNENLSASEEKKVLKEGDFYIAQCANKWFDMAKIVNFKIYLKKNEIAYAESASPSDVYNKVSLGEVLPQKNYDDMFMKTGFYIYVKRYNPQSLKGTRGDSWSEVHYYNEIKKAFKQAAHESVAT